MSKNDTQIECNGLIHAHLNNQFIHTSCTCWSAVPRSTYTFIFINQIHTLCPISTHSIWITVVIICNIKLFNIRTMYQNV